MKFANAIVVGGPIAVGKSTLVATLPFPNVTELTSNDELQRLLLSEMYAGNQIATQIFQLDMMLHRFHKYALLANREVLTVFDRSIFEDRFFAQLLLSTAPRVHAYYQELWSLKVRELLQVVGAPKLYVLLTCDWATFKQRVHRRAREAEVINFVRNEAYFKTMVENYESFMRSTFTEFNLPFVVINTNYLTHAEVAAATLAALAKQSIVTYE